MKKSTVKIAHLITTLDIGGAETMLCKLVSDRRGTTACRHSVICLSGAGKLGEVLGSQKVPFFSMGMQKRVSDIGAVFRLVKLLRSIRPHVIQTWLYHADLIGLIAGRIFTDAKIVWNVRCSDMNLSNYGLSTKLSFFILAKLSRVPHGIIFNSEAGRSYHFRSGYSTSRAIVIPNGFDISRYRPDKRFGSDLRKELGICDTDPVVGMAARFDPMKDHMNFFNAAGSVAKRIPNVKFVLAGKGLTRQNHDVKRMIQRNGLEKCLFLLGEQRDLTDIYPAFDLCTLTSSYGEGFPNVLGEAMSCGIPCVATDVGDSAFIIKDTGIVVPPNDPEALAGAWERLLNLSVEERTDLGRMARHRIESNFTLTRIRDRYDRYLSEICAG